MTHFEPKNDVTYYAIMMQFLQDDLILLFKETKYAIVINKSTQHIMCDDRIILDDVFLFSNHIFQLSFTLFLCYTSLYTVKTLFRIN